MEKYKDLRFKYESWVKNGSKGYDIGNYKSELDNAQSWLKIHKRDNA